MKLFKGKNPEQFKYVRKPYTVEELKRKFELAKTTQDEFMQRILEAYKYVSPGRNAISVYYGGTDVGVDVNSYITNSVAEQASKKRANQMVRMLTPPDQQWGYFEVDFDIIRQDAKVNFTPEDQTAALDTYYTLLNASNFKQQITSAMLDYNISAGALWIEKDDKAVFSFEALPGCLICPEYCNGSLIKDLWYRYFPSYSYLQNKYPQVDLIDFKEVTRIEVCRGVIEDVNENGKLLWRYVDIIFGGSDAVSKFPIILNDKYSSIKQLVYFRESVRPGEMTGRGPAIELLPEIKRLIKLTSIFDTGAMLRGVPPIEVDQALYKQGTKNNGIGQSYPHNTFGRPFVLPESPSIETAIERLTQLIESGFMVQPLGGLDLPKMSATEAAERIDMSQQYSTVDSSQVILELNACSFENSFKIAVEQNKIPKSAEIKYILNNYPDALTFKYINPLGDIQKSINLTKINQFLGLLRQDFGPESVFTTMEIGNTFEFLVDNSGLPRSLFPTKEKMTTALQQIIQGAQQNAPQQNDTLPGVATQGQTPPISVPSYNI
jgi:Bacteriophage head to tail connecting protein